MTALNQKNRRNGSEVYNSPKEQYEDAVSSYFGTDDEVSHSVIKLIRTRTDHECMGIDHEGGDIPAGVMAIREKAIHVDAGRVSCYVCLPCADKWVAEIYSELNDQG